MSYALRLCKQHWPLGTRVHIKRFWWVDSKTGHQDQCDGTVIKHWQATGDRPGITVMCDDGREHSGEPCVLWAKKLDEHPIGQIEMFCSQKVCA
jgi:hypothetical protein